MAAEPMLPRIDEPEGWDRPGRGRAARVQFTDGSWRCATVLGWRHREDRWYAHLQWPGGSSDWLAYDPKYIRPE
ncbi:MAG TPA: hypothetical protein DHU96_34165 [Actinobacteria bacterium]|nr:hypothetical protein [Actinomycetota bacterium]